MAFFVKSLILGDFAKNDEFAGEGLNHQIYFQLIAYVGVTPNSDNVAKNHFARCSRLGVMPVRRHIFQIPYCIIEEDW